MLKYICAAMLQSFFMIAAASAYANPIVLYCVTDGASEGIDYTVDIEKKTVYWSKYVRYRITQVNNDYITAVVTSPDMPGGTIWVLNRSNSEFKNVWVGMGMLAGEAEGKLKLETLSSGGKCN